MFARETESRTMRDDAPYHKKNATDNRQIEALKNGSAEVWRETLTEIGPRLLSYATRMLGDKSAAEEVVQDALVNVYKTIDRFDGRCSIKSWLYRAVRNRSIDEIRRQKRFIDIGDDPDHDYFDETGHWQVDCFGWDGAAAKALDNKNMLKLVHREINNLPHSHREVLLLKEVEGLDADEICAALDISAGNLRIRIHRARYALKAAVGYKLDKE